MVRFVSIQLLFWTLSPPRSKAGWRERPCIILLAIDCLTRAVQFKFWVCESRSLIKAQTTTQSQIHTHTQTIRICVLWLLFEPSWANTLHTNELATRQRRWRRDRNLNSNDIRLKFHYAQHTLRLSVLFAFIHFYSFCAGARVVLFKFRLQFVSICRIVLYLSIYDHLASECECAVRVAVRLCWSHNTDWNLLPASRWNRLMPHRASSLTFSVFFSPLYRFYFGGGRSSSRPATRFTNKSRDRRNSNTTTTKATAAAAATASTFLLALSSWAVVTMLEKFTEPVFVSYSIYYITWDTFFHCVNVD